MPVSWNADLVRASEARVCYHVSIGSSREFMWRKAAAEIRAVEKDIRVQSSGRIVNMPRLREKTAQQELEAIIRGEKLVVPPEMVQAAQAPPERDFDQHPYLRRMEYRGGGFAILMAFELRRRQQDSRNYMFKSELAREAQPFCDISMLSTDGWVRSAVVGWASHRSLLSHRLLVASCSAGREEYSLTEDGQRFLSAMLLKWPHAPPEPAAVGEAAADQAPERAEGAERPMVQQESPRTERADSNMNFSLQDAPLQRKRKTWATGALSSCDVLVGGVVAALPTPQHQVEVSSTVTSSETVKRQKTDSFEDANAGFSGREVVKAPSVSPGSAASSSSAQSRGPIAGRSVEGHNEHAAQLSDAAAEAQQCVSVAIADAETQIEISQIEVSSQEEQLESAAPEAAETDIENSDQEDDQNREEVGLRLLVDDRERIKDSDPRGLLDRVSAAVSGPNVDVSRHHLQIGDFAWVAGAQSCSSTNSTILDCVVERKRISDLVGRSAVGAHAQQMQRMEACGLRRCFLLLEGDANLAARCRVYDEVCCSDSHGVDDTHVIRSKEDIDRLCARLLVTSSTIGVIVTKDAECTARMLSHLSQWLAQSLTPTGLSLRDFEKQTAGFSRLQETLRSALLVAGVPLQAARSICERLHSIQHARDTMKSCASLEHRLHLLDSLPHCAGLGERICCALGLSAPPAAEPLKLSDRRVFVDASPEMMRRVFALETPACVIVHERPSLAHDRSKLCLAEVCVRAEMPGCPTRKFCSKPMLLVVIPGAWVTEAVLQAVADLGCVGAPVDIALHAARALEGMFPMGEGSIRVAIVEGLRSAVQCEARQAHGQVRTLTNLLGLVELTTLTLDLSLGWRIRVHDVRSTSTTVNFVQTLISTAREEAYLPLDA